MLHGGAVSRQPATGAKPPGLSGRGDGCGLGDRGQVRKLVLALDDEPADDAP